MRLAICEDNAVVCRQLADLISGHDSNYKIVVYKTGDKLWFDCENKSNLYDIIFLDIELPGVLSGLDAAKKLRQQGDTTSIVILTSYAKYALEGYAVKPLQYLLKPLQPEPLLAALREAEQIARVAWDDSLNIQTPGGYMRIPYHRILYFESQGNYVHIHTDDNTHTLRRKMPEIELLCDHRFLTPHKSYLINIDHMLFLGSQNTVITMDNGAELPVSRNRKNLFVKSLVEYDRLYNNNRFKIS